MQRGDRVGVVPELGQQFRVVLTLVGHELIFGRGDLLVEVPGSAGYADLAAMAAPHEDGDDADLAEGGGPGRRAGRSTGTGAISNQPSTES